MFIAEVVETKKAYKPNQKDERGNPLPLGSIEIRLGSHQSNLGQVRNIYARPATFNRRIPLIGEQVLVFSAPTNDWSTSAEKGVGFMYMSTINGTDDLVLHAFPQLWKRKGLAPSGNSGQRKSDKEEPGYTFPKNPSKLDRLQPYDGDDLIEGRFGTAIRLTSTIKGGDMSVYAKKPSWDGMKNGDPLMIISVREPSGSGSGYTVEDINDDKSSIYLTSTQNLSKLKAGFSKNTDAKQIGQFKSGSQIVLNSDRVVLNSVKDILMLIGNKSAILTGKKVIFQSDKYKVDLDDLMDWLKELVDEDKKLASGQAQYSTACGPTAVATNLSNYIQLSTTKFQKFKLP